MALNDFFSEKVEPDLKIQLWDGNNLFYRVLYTAQYEYTKHKNNWEQGVEDTRFTIDDMMGLWKHYFLSSLFSGIKTSKPNSVLVALDSKDTWRKQVYPEYKANRVKNDFEGVPFDQTIKTIFDFIHEIEIVFPTIKFIQVDHCEADDIIAILTKFYAKKVENTVEIISSDGDYKQLQIYKNVSQYDPKKKENIISLNPKRELEIKILTGDPGDNIKNVRPKLGPVTADKILKEGLEFYLSDSDFKKNYIRNTLLIDFNKIPENIELEIMNKFNGLQIKKMDIMKIRGFFVQHKLNKLLDDWQSTFQYLKDLR